ncbi:hypothetical protein [Brevundimonas sp.]|uniref:hypothetical protein n=1 Tax=Brevundimonas sp. TaxID=1871086 RepID=UPI003F717179
MTDSKKRRSAPRIRLGLALVAVMSFICAGLPVWMWHDGLLDTVEMSTSLIMCLVVGFTLGGSALTYTPEPIPDTGRIGKPVVEPNLSWQLVSNVVAGLLWTAWGTMQAVSAFGDEHHFAGYAYASLVLLWLYVSPATLMGWAPQGKQLRDDPDRELNHAFRARATASGFWVLLAGGAAAFLISFSAPAMLTYVLPFALWLGGSVACVHFVWLHRQADKGLGDDG